MDFNIPLLLTHHSVLGTDECPLKNSATLIDFVQKHKINHVFCGHTHELELMRTNDLYHGHTFDQFMCGTLSARNHPNDDNMFLYYENLGTMDMHLYVMGFADGIPFHATLFCESVIRARFLSIGNSIPARRVTNEQKVEYARNGIALPGYSL